MSMNKHELGRVIPAVTQEYSLGFRCNSRKTVELNPHHEMKPNSPACSACMQSNSMLTIQKLKEP